DPSANQRLYLHYDAVHFDPNAVEIAVENDRSAPAWLVYCATWHPGWSATVNGSPAPVRRANLAYKAILIPPGHSVTRFEFHLPLLDWLDRALALDSLAWLIALGWIVTTILRPLFARGR